MAATIATSLLASQLILLLCTTATATAPLPGFPAVVNGAVPPTPETTAGGSGLSKLPFPGGQPRLPFPFLGGQPRLPFPFPGGQPRLPFPFLGGQPRLPFPFPGGQPRLPFPFPDEPPHLPFPFPGGNNPTDCLNVVHQAESCVVDVLRSLASPAPGEGVVSTGKACCATLQAVRDRCFRGVLPVSPFRALYAPFVRHACGGGGPIPGLGGLAPGPRV